MKKQDLWKQNCVKRIYKLHIAIVILTLEIAIYAIGVYENVLRRMIKFEKY